MNRIPYNIKFKTYINYIHIYMKISKLNDINNIRYKVVNTFYTCQIKKLKKLTY